MTQPFVIGLTGGIGSGKTAVSDYFAQQGIDIIDADVISHEITKKDSPLLKELVKVFGDWVLDSEGNYDRSAMRAHVFSNHHALKTLNALTHPAIRHTILTALKESHSPYVILSVPLLFETRHATPSLFELCHHFLVIDIPPELQLSRASQRDNKSPEQIQSIIDKQISRAERLHIATTHQADIIKNNHTLQALYNQLNPLHQRYLSMSQINQLRTT